jgi:ethanolamine utilization protein EutM
LNTSVNAGGVIRLRALGLIETVGYTTAVSAADAAVKAADVEIIGIEKVIGVNGSLGVTIHLGGDVGAVKAAVEAGQAEGERIGKVISADVIARVHDDVDRKLISLFGLNEGTTKEEIDTKEKKQSEKSTKTKSPEKTKVKDEA